MADRKKEITTNDLIAFDAHRDRPEATVLLLVSMTVV